MVFSLNLRGEAALPSCNIPATEAITVAAQIDIDQLLKDLDQLKTIRGKKVLNAKETRADLEKIFNLKTPTSKLKQFYQLLYVIGDHSKLILNPGFALDLPAVRKILLTAKVFPTPDFPNQISVVFIELTRHSRLQYHVRFKNRETIKLPLNEGLGFKAFENGMCQHVTHLIFYGDFSFRVKKLPNDNFSVYEFDGVDLYGNFGTRGLIDVDMNYIELEKVEFLNNSVLGKVTAYVSETEFEKNDHSWLLKFASRVFPNTSLQAIDW